ncbi:MAG: DNA-3-methyladenine glycosylase, partial [Candidatus Dormiibacterota bacterium]
MARLPLNPEDRARTPSDRLTRKFFARPSPLVARELLGCFLVRQLEDLTLRVRISETEAYLGLTDPASHAF